MEVRLPPDLDSKLRRSAARQGRNPDEVLQDVLARHFESEERFADAVKLGEEAIERGECLTHQQVGQRLHRFLQR